MSKSNPDKGGRLTHHYRTPPRTLEQLGRIVALATIFSGALLKGIAIPVDINAQQFDNRVAYVKTETARDQQFEQKMKDDPLVVTVVGTNTTVGEDVNTLQSRADRTHNIANKIGLGGSILAGFGVLIGTLNEAFGLRRRRAESVVANAGMRKALASQAKRHQDSTRVAVGRVRREDIPLPQAQRTKNDRQHLALQTLDVRHKTDLASTLPEIAPTRDDLSSARETLGYIDHEFLATLHVEEREAAAAAKADRGRRETASILALYSPALAECSRGLDAIRAELAATDAELKSIRQDFGLPSYEASKASPTPEWPTADSTLPMLAAQLAIEETTQGLPVLAAA